MVRRLQGRLFQGFCYTDVSPDIAVGTGDCFADSPRGFARPGLPSCGEQTDRNVFHGLLAFDLDKFTFFVIVFFIIIPLVAVVLRCYYEKQRKYL